MASSKTPEAVVGPKWADACSRPAYTMYELEMQAASYALRSKADWQTKRLDETIAAKWKQEILEQSAARAKADLPADEAEFPGSSRNWEWRKLTEAHVDYLLAELELHARDLNKSNVSRSCTHGVYESSSLVSPALKDRLRDGVSKLENVLDEQQDWHPGSNHQVLDLVHPSLYPVTWGKTVVTLLDGTCIVPRDPDVFQDKVVEKLVPAEGDDIRRFVATDAKKDHQVEKWRRDHRRFNRHRPRKPRFQWLPADFDVDADGGVKIAPGSYINNLNPDGSNSGLYSVLEELLAQSLPLFERVLGDLAQDPARCIVPEPPTWWQEANIPDPAHLDSDSEDYYQEHDRWTESQAYSDEGERLKTFIVPVPQPFDGDKTQETTAAPFNLKGRRLQVIVKLANIVLTPEKPVYPGGTWHVEGVESECIVASSIFYYDNSNVTPSTLSFRAALYEEDRAYMFYEQNDDRGVKIAYGFEQETVSNQARNGASTTEDKFLAFPNLYQHRVSPFELVDKTRGGHRKIVCFFLVDPCHSLLSTVAPQQREWYATKIFAPSAEPRDGQGGVRLPPELCKAVLEKSEGLLSLDEAKKVREELMKERKHIIDEEGEIMRYWSLCEH